MKKVLALLTISGFCLTSAFAQAPGSWANVSKYNQGELYVVYYDQIGLVERNQAGQLQGFCIDLLSQFTNYVNNKYGKKITLKYFQEEDFNRYCELLDKEPYWLGVGNISITDERKLKYKFTPPYMPNVLRLVTHANTPTIMTPQDIATQLRGYTGYAISSSVSEKALEKMKKSYLSNMPIKTKETSLLTLEAVSADSRGFTVIDFTELLTAKRKNLPVKFHPVKMDKTEDLGFMMSKKSDWDVIWNEFLTDEYKSSQTFKGSVMKYFGADFLSAITSKK